MVNHEHRSGTLAIEKQNPEEKSTADKPYRPGMMREDMDLEAVIKRMMDAYKVDTYRDLSYALGFKGRSGISKQKASGSLTAAVLIKCSRDTDVSTDWLVDGIVRNMPEAALRAAIEQDFHEQLEMIPNRDDENVVEWLSGEVNRLTKLVMGIKDNDQPQALRKTG
jgi:hypothetical protein